jgi:hypothetical protein
VSAKIFNWLGLIVIAGIIAVIARNPAVVSNFFSGFNAVLGTALAGGGTPAAAAKK